MTERWQPSEGPGQSGPGGRRSGRRKGPGVGTAGRCGGREEDGQEWGAEVAPSELEAGRNVLPAARAARRAEAEGPGGGGRSCPTASPALATFAVLQMPAIARKRPQRAVRKDTSCGWGRAHLPGSGLHHLGENLFLGHPWVETGAPPELQASSEGSAAGFEVFTRRWKWHYKNVSSYMTKRAILFRSYWEGPELP